MCGIVGVANRKGTRGGGECISEMMRVQKHRGPDDEGHCVIDFKGHQVIVDCEHSSTGDCFFGFNRLSIQDVSLAGHQPMVSGEATIAIVYNGEIYNALALKERYLGQVDLKGHSDTEVILKLYEELGFKAMVELLDGMFAIAIADASCGKLYLARDRVGIKPLYLYTSSEHIAFASEVKSLLVSGLFVPEIDETAVRECMLFGYNYQRTLFKQVRPLDPGCCIEYDFATDSLNEWRYWDVAQCAAGKRNQTSREELASESCQILAESVEGQLVSDVLVGCQVSGGVDSSLICNLLMKGRSTFCAESGLDVSEATRVTQFGIGVVFDDPVYSEEQYMDMVGEYLGMDIQKVPLESQWVCEAWESAAWHLDGIPGFANELGIMLLAKRAKERVTVLLSGEGADELFCGYARLIEYAPFFGYSGLLERLGRKRSLVDKLLGHSLYRGRTPSADALALYSGDAIGLKSMKQLFGENYDEGSVVELRRKAIDRLMQVSNIGAVDVLRCCEISIRLPALLNRQDKMTMASSVENRVPFLGNNVIDFALSLKTSDLSRIKIGSGRPCIEGKLVLKDACARFFGKKFAFRKKVGFPLPLDEYLFCEGMEEGVAQALSLLRETELIEVDFLSELYEKGPRHCSEEEKRILWRSVSLGLYLLACRKAGVIR